MFLTPKLGGAEKKIAPFKKDNSYWEYLDFGNKLGTWNQFRRAISFGKNAITPFPFKTHKL